MNKLEQLFKEQHPDYDESLANQRIKMCFDEINKEREDYAKNNNWLTIDEIIKMVNDVRKN